MHQRLQPIALLASSLFLAMLLASTACMAVQDLSHHSPESHHSKTKPLHGVLCTWACHIEKLSSTSLTTSPSWHSPFQALGAVLPLHALSRSLPSLSNKSARAPPHFFLSFSS
ncbi:hypothetical protein [uncultured Nitrospira sp.]|uniref:hypothetical protein n=1 Tax=uncultured Nitrospira sp. TaxID=157176 RepID=UPI00313FFFDE